MKLNNESKKIDYQNQQALKTIENDFILKKQENENKAQIETMKLQNEAKKLKMKIKKT